MKLFVIAAALLMIAPRAQGQSSQVEITGGEKVENYFPFNSSTAYLYSADLYLSSEIKANGRISSIAFYQCSGSSTSKCPCKIYLATTKSESLPSDDWSTLIGAATLVYDGYYCWETSGGWVDFTLDRSFAYNGSDNLLVLCESNIGGCGGKGNECYLHFRTSGRSATATGTEKPPSKLCSENMTSWILLTLGPLPVQLTLFAARTDGSDITLVWHTASETNNYGFWIQTQRREDAEFVDIPGSFTAGHGTTVRENTYTYTTTGTDAPQSWFRLKQVDLDGSVHFSEPVSVVMTAIKEQNPVTCMLLQNFPNPFNPSTSIRYGVSHTSQAVLSVCTVLGEEVAQLVSGLIEAGYHEAVFVPDGLPSGVYVYRLRAGDYVETKTMVLLK
jgi:hypothetical protein